MMKNDNIPKQTADAENREEKSLIIIGRVAELKEITTINSARMAIFSLRNTAGKAEVVVFPEAYEASGDAIQEGKNVVLLGKENEGDAACPQFIASKVASAELLEKLLSVNTPS